METSQPLQAIDTTSLQATPVGVKRKKHDSADLLVANFSGYICGHSKKQCTETGK